MAAPNDHMRFSKRFANVRKRRSCAASACRDRLRAVRAGAAPSSTTIGLRRHTVHVIVLLTVVIHVTEDSKVTLSLCCSLYGRPPLVALKAVPSGDLGTNAWSVRGQSASTSQREQQQEQSGKVRAKAIASGLYTYYEDPSGLNIGNVRQAAPGASSFTSLQDCANACDDDSK